MQDIERRTSHHVMVTIGLFCSVQLLLNFLDRSNISFAALQMNGALGLTPQAYGFAIGVFFIGHIVFSLPGAALARHFGARRVLSAMIVVWGLFAAGMGLVHTPTALFVVRFLLGVAEAGAASIVTLVLTNWVPRSAFARVMVLVTLAQPVGQMIGAPLSGLLMTRLDGAAGVEGWRWMFGIEGLVTVLFGLFSWSWLRNRPEEARWLGADEKAWLVAELARDAARASEEAGHRARTTFRDVLGDGRIWIFGIILFCIATGVYLFTFWLPQVLAQDRGGSGTLAITSLSAVPWIGMMIGMIGFGWSSDRLRERPRHLAAAMSIGAFGIALGSANAGSPLGVFGLSLGALGLGGAVTVFWTMPSAYMAGTAGAAPAFAIINVIGNLTGVITPNVIGRLRAISGSFQSTLYLTVVVLAIGLVLIVPVAGRRRAPAAALA